MIEVVTTYAIDSTDGEYFGTFVVDTEDNSVYSKEEFERIILEDYNNSELLKCVELLINYSDKNVIRFYFGDYFIELNDDTMYTDYDYDYIEEMHCYKENNCWYIPLILNYGGSEALSVYEVDPRNEKVREILYESEIYQNFVLKIYGSY